MNTRSWIFYGDRSGHYRIALYHGPKSGHVLVVCNNRVMIIDFMILKEKKYSFFIDDDLCEIRIFPVEDGFDYSFRINRDAKTPKNEFERKRKKRERIKGILFATGLALAVVFVLFYFQQKNQRHYMETLPQDGLISVGRIFKDTTDQEETITYYFTHKSRIFSGSTNVEEIEPLREGFGLPIRHGQEYKVIFHPNQPKVNRLLYDEPTNRQRNQFILEALQTCEAVQFKRVGEKCICFLEEAMKILDDEAIPLMINQQVSANENPRFNKQTFQAFIQDSTFQRRFNQRCVGIIQ